MRAPSVSPGTGTLWPRGAGFACSRKGHTFSSSGCFITAIR